MAICIRTLRKIAKAFAEASQDAIPPWVEKQKSPVPQDAVPPWVEKQKQKQPKPTQPQAKPPVSDKLTRYLDWLHSLGGVGGNA